MRNGRVGSEPRHEALRVSATDPELSRWHAQRRLPRFSARIVLCPGTRVAIGVSRSDATQPPDPCSVPHKSSANSQAYLAAYSLPRESQTTRLTSSPLGGRSSILHLQLRSTVSQHRNNMISETIRRVNGYEHDAYTYYPVVIVGAGASGIAMACQLKQQLGFDQFRIFERQAGIGGTWWINRYPGVAW
jgi:hypothetical protein